MIIIFTDLGPFLEIIATQLVNIKANNLAYPTFLSKGGQFFFLERNKT